MNLKMKSEKNQYDVIKLLTEISSTSRWNMGLRGWGHEIDITENI